VKKEDRLKATKVRLAIQKARKSGGLRVRKKIGPRADCEAGRAPKSERMKCSKHSRGRGKKAYTHQTGRLEKILNKREYSLFPKKGKPTWCREKELDWTKVRHTQKSHEKQLFSLNWGRPSVKGERNWNRLVAKHAGGEGKTANSPSGKTAVRQGKRDAAGRRVQRK